MKTFLLLISLFTSSFLLTQIDNEEIVNPDNEVTNETELLVDLSPTFPGGTVSLEKYINSNIIYSSEAQNTRIQGNVTIQFAVGTDGTLSEVYIVKGIGYGCDEEAKRLVENMPNWIPGEYQGEKVKATTIIAIPFKTN